MTTGARGLKAEQEGLQCSARKRSGERAAANLMLMMSMVTMMVKKGVGNYWRLSTESERGQFA
jgi:hypothetical protein